MNDASGCVAVIGSAEENNSVVKFMYNLSINLSQCCPNFTFCGIFSMLTLATSEKVLLNYVRKVASSAYGTFNFLFADI